MVAKEAQEGWEMVEAGSRDVMLFVCVVTS